MKKFTLITAIILAVCSASAQIIHVPADYSTIQAGIDAATTGDTVLVDTGTYYENIRFKGKAITVASQFIMDGDSSHRENTIINGSHSTDPDSAATVMFVNGEDTTSIINGFTITEGSGVFYVTYQVRAGGGVYSYNAGSKIINNIIRGNHVEDADRAGGVGIANIMDTGDFWTVVRDNNIDHNSSLSNGFTAFGGGLGISTNCYIENNIIEYNTCTNTNGATDGGGIELEAFPGLSPVAYVNNNKIRYNELSSTSSSLGAGIICYGFTPEIKDNVISDNSSTAQTIAVGGGVLVKKAPGSVEITNNTIENNNLVATEGAYGGGIRVVNNLKGENISDNIICSNTTDGGNNAWGAGIAAYSSIKINITNNIIENNSSNSTSGQSGGAGINLLKCGKSFIDNNEINKNSLTAGTNSWGGGILIDKGTDTVFIHNNMVNDNTITGTGNGGGISFYSTNDIVVSINSNQIKNNYSSYRGGGLSARNTYRINILNNIFIGNESGSIGGAILFFETSSKASRDTISHPVIANNTFINNTTSHFGGAIYSGYNVETPVVFNSIFLENSANYAQDLYNSSSSDMAVYNNNLDTANISTPWSGDGNINEDLKFIDDSLCLIDASSPCFNAGIDRVMYEGEYYACPATDYQDEPRPSYGGVDIGADEFYVVGFEEIKVQSPKSKIWNYPNPFTTSTTIAYELKQPSTAQITIYNHLGKQIEIIQQNQSQGKQQVVWNAEELPSGVYFCVLKTNEGTKTTKMIKMKR